MSGALLGPEVQAAGSGRAPGTQGTLMSRALLGLEVQASGCGRAPGTKGADLGPLVPVQEPPLTSPCASCTSAPGDGCRSSGSSSPTSHSRCCCGGPMPWATPTTPTTWSSSEPGWGAPFGPQCEACVPHSGPETNPLSSCAQPGRQMRELGGLPGEAPGGQMSPSTHVQSCSWKPGLRLLSLPHLGKANDPQRSF